MICAGRYMAPELYANPFGGEEIDTSVDVFSFALIVQEVYNKIETSSLSFFAVFLFDYCMKGSCIYSHIMSV